MAAKQPKRPAPREGEGASEPTPEYPADGKFWNVVNRLLAVAANERFNVDQDHMAQAFDAAKSKVSDLYPQG